MQYLPMNTNVTAHLYIDFKTKIPLRATYLLVTADFLSGAGPVTFRKDL